MTNSAFLFSNVSKEGWRSSAESFKDAPVSYVGKTIATNIVAPKVLVALAAYGWLGDELKEVLDRIPDHYKRNYLIIPLGLDSNNRAIFVKLPYDHVGQTISNLVWQMLDSDDRAREAMQSVSEILPWSPARLHPYIQAGIGAIQYLGGTNPPDLWYGRPAIPERYFKEGRFSKNSVQAYMEWTLNKLGASVVVVRDPESIDQPDTILDQIYKVPIAGPFVRRFVQVTDYGLTEELSQQQRKARQGRARLSNHRTQFIMEVLENTPKASIDDVHASMRELGIAYQKKSQLKARIKQLQQRRSSDPYTRALSYANTKEDKERVLRQKGNER